MIINKIKIIFFIVSIATTLSACGQSQNQPQVDNSSSSTIVISPEMVNLEREKSIQFTAIVKDAKGNTIEAVPVWEVVGDIGEITSMGLFNAKKIGSGSVKASIGGKSVSASVSVAEVGEVSFFAISRLWLSPNNDGVMDRDLFGFSLPNKRRVSLKLCKLSGEIVGTIYNEEAQGEINWYWDGKIIESSAVAADGEYLIKLLVDGEEIAKTLRVNVDSTGPVISLLLDQSVISPDGDGIKDLLTIDYSISDLSATTEIEAVLYKDNHINYGLQNEDNCQSNANNRIIWDGKRDSLVFNGKYVVWIRSTDKAGNKSIATKEVVVDALDPSISSSVIVSSPNFSPNGDGVKDQTDIIFSVMNDYSLVSLTVLITNGDGTTVRELVKDKVVGNEEQTVSWDGKAGNGLIVANGDYSYKIMLEDEGGNKNIYSGQINVDCQLPQVNSLTDSPDPFTPNENGIKDVTIISFSLSETCDGRIDIYRADDSLFKSYFFSDKSSGDWGWDGKGEHEQLVGSPGEELKYRLTVVDKAGNTSTSETNTVYCDRVPSLHKYLYGDPDPFNARAGETSQICFGLVRDCLKVTIKIGDSVTVKTLLDNVVYSNKGDYSVTWTGDYDPGYSGPKDIIDGTKVSAGGYTISIWIDDPTEPPQEHSSTTIYVNNH